MRNTGTARLFAPASLHPVRLALSIGGIVFEDNVLSPTDTAESHQTELWLNAERMTQSSAMLICAGRLGGSYPTNSSVMALQVDEILHVLTELQAKMNYDEVSESTIVRYAALIDARLRHLQEISAFEAYKDNVLIHEIALYCWAKSVREMGLAREIDKRDCIVHIEVKLQNNPSVKHLEANQDSRDDLKLKLTYFPFPGRAEPIRLALFISGIPFEDERIGVDELNRRRSTLPFNQLPVLDVNGVVVSQALAILRYVGTLGGLYSPSDIMEALRIDESFSLIDEFYSSYAWNASYFEKDPTKQMKLRSILAEETLPNTMRLLEERVSKWNGRYSVGDRLTVADLAIYSLLWTFQSGRIAGVPTSVVAPYTKLVNIYETVAAHSAVVEWYLIKH
ncbi:hypothetical protein V7S43_001398 [Phytophthora oleae]|uniref:Glutathione S-transferase n=1 Tax=Phytophthora oleae TaxID=2107226 RepID=A0ABD3G4V5_9STRA